MLRIHSWVSKFTTCELSIWNEYQILINSLNLLIRDHGCFVSGKAASDWIKVTLFILFKEVLKIGWIKQSFIRRCILSKQTLRICSLDKCFLLTQSKLVSHKVVKFGLIPSDETESWRNSLILVIVIKVLHRSLIKRLVCCIKNRNTLKFCNESTGPLADDELLVVVKTGYCRNLMLYISLVSTIELGHQWILANYIIHLSFSKFSWVSILKVFKNLMINQRIFAKFISLNPLSKSSYIIEAISRIWEY